MANKTIPLTRRYSAHDTAFDSITLREPVYTDFFDLGEPQQWQRTQHGDVVLLTIPEIVKGYIDRCCIEPGPECLPVINARDAKALQDAILGFFRDPPASTPTGEATEEPSGAPSTTSSSTSDGDQPTSQD